MSRTPLSPVGIARVMQQASLRLRTEFMAAARDNQDLVLRTAQELSSGPFGRTQLRVLGHPYARHRRGTALPPAVINRQSGQFLGAWKPEAPVWTGGRLQANVINTAPHGVFFRGTRYMVNRPIVAAIEDQVQEAVDRRWEQALARVGGSSYG